MLNTTSSLLGDFPAAGALPLLLIGKIVLISFLVLYLIFALLIPRQIEMMNHVIETVEKNNLKKFGQLHLLLSALLLVLVLVFF